VWRAHRLSAGLFTARERPKSWTPVPLPENQYARSDNWRRRGRDGLGTSAAGWSTKTTTEVLINTTRAASRASTDCAERCGWLWRLFPLHLSSLSPVVTPSPSDVIRQLLQSRCTDSENVVPLSRFDFMQNSKTRVHGRNVSHRQQLNLQSFRFSTTNLQVSGINAQQIESGVKSTTINSKSRTNKTS